ncbi:MAG TPA: hypothetical protein PKV72_06775, partial [Candidatus Peribacteria bacterium]|nr:hypothetical protein [Candidatus Peribacteria bacterium]
TSGSLGLKIIQTASGNIIHAEKTLTSSGNIIAVGSIVTRNTLSGKTLVVSGNASVTGALVVKKSISGAALEILGTASGADIFATRSVTGTNLYAATTFGGAGLASCSNATTSKLLYDSATKRFSCGTDQTGGGSTAPEVGTLSFSGAVLRLGDARYVKKAGDTMTGQLVINLTAGNIGLNVLAGMSGNTLTVSKGASLAGSGITITSSGQTVFNRLNRNVDFNIRGNSDSSLFYVDASSNAVGIGTVLPKAKLDILGTLSGKTLTISGNGSFSGALVVKKSISGASLEVLGTISGVNVVASGTGTRPLIFASAPWSSVGIGSNTPTQRLTVSGGTILNVAGGTVRSLSGVNLGTQMNDMVVVGRYAYVAGGNSPNFRIVDISNPLNPKTVSSLNFGYAVQSIAVSGKYAYVGSTTTTNENLRIIDISNPFVPVQAASLSVAGGMVGVQAMAINGKTLYLGKAVDFSTAEFVIADITNPLAPKMLSSIDFGSSVGINSIAIQGKYAYVGADDDASSGNELRIFDISSPNNPIEKGGLSLGAGVKSINVVGPYAYVGL